VEPIKDTTYTLIAKNFFGISKKELNIKISNKPPEIKTFTADSLIRSNSEPIKLSWSIDDANELILNPGNINVLGKNSCEVKPLKDTTYTLLAKSFLGISSQKEISISISKRPPEITNLSADKLIRTDSTPIKLSWQVNNAHEIHLEPNHKTVTKKNSIEVDPMQDTIYTLVATSFFGVISKKEIKIEISKEPPVIFFFTANKIIRTDSDPITLSWKIENVYEIHLEPDNKIVTGENSIEIDPMQDTVYTLVATSFFGIISRKEIKIEISKEPPIIKSFNANKLIRTDSDPITLNWKIENAHEIHLAPDKKIVTGKGSTRVEPLKDTLYTLRARSYFGYWSESKISIDVSKQPPTIKHFGYIPKSYITDEYELIWEVESARKIIINPDSEDVTNLRSLTIKLEKKIEYSLYTESIFGFSASKTLKIKPLFIQDPEDNIFNPEIKDDIYNPDPSNELFIQL
jgi:hypothetical protein